MENNTGNKKTLWIVLAVTAVILLSVLTVVLNSKPKRTFEIAKPQLVNDELTYTRWEKQTVELRDDSYLNDGYTLSGVLEATDAGTYTVTATLKPGYRWVGGGTDPVELTWVILPRTVRMVAFDTGKTYGEADKGLDAHARGEGLTQEEADKITYDTVVREEGENVGEYRIVVTGKENQGNYKVEFVSGTFTIVPKKISVETDNQTMREGDPLPQLTCRTDGPLVGDDMIVGTPEIEGGLTVGQHAILQGTLTVADGNDGRNYEIEYFPGTLTVESDD